MKALIMVVIVLSLFSNILQSQSESFSFTNSVCGTFYADETTSNGANIFEKYLCLSGSINTFRGKEKIFKIYVASPRVLQISMTDFQFPPKLNKLFNRRRLLFNKIGAEINAYKKCQI